MFAYYDKSNILALLDIIYQLKVFMFKSREIIEASILGMMYGNKSIYST